MLKPESLLPLLDDGGSAVAAAAGSPAAGRQRLAAGWPQQALAAPASPPMLPCLRELDVSYCPLPQPVLAALLTCGARLHSLSINGCRGGVTDALWPLLHRRAEELCQPGSSGGGSGMAASSGAAVGKRGAVPGTPPGAAAELPPPPLAAPGFRGWAPEPAGPYPSSTAADPSAAVDAAAEQLAATAVASQSSELPAEDPAGASWPPAADAPGACQRQQGDAQQQAYRQQVAPAAAEHQLRSLSMVGSKELRCFCLGLAPAAAALERGLLLGGGTVAVQGGQQYALVATPLAGLRELRLSLSGAWKGEEGDRLGGLTGWAAPPCLMRRPERKVCVGPVVERQHCCSAEQLCGALLFSSSCLNPNLPPHLPTTTPLPQAACGRWRWAWPTCRTCSSTTAWSWARWCCTAPPSSGCPCRWVGGRVGGGPRVFVLLRRLAGAVPCRELPCRAHAVRSRRGGW